MSLKTVDEKGKKVDGDVLVSVVLKHSPKDVKDMLRGQAHIFEDDFSKFNL